MSHERPQTGAASHDAGEVNEYTFCLTIYIEPEPVTVVHLGCIG